MTKASRVVDMPHESRDLFEDRALQTNGTDFASLHATSDAQSLEMTTNTEASERPSTINQSATFFGMPREIRDLIYDFVFPDIQLKRAVIPAKLSKEMTKWNAAELPITKVFGRLVTKDKSNIARFTQSFTISRQFRDEILPVFYKKHVFAMRWDQYDLPNTIAWLQYLLLEQLKLVQNIRVSVYLNGLQLPLRWMQAEEELAQRCGSPLNLILGFESRNDRHFWILAYSKCLARRLAGWTWEEIREQADAIHAEADQQRLALAKDDGVESSDDANSDSDEDDSDSDEDY